MLSVTNVLLQMMKLFIIKLMFDNFEYFFDHIFYTTRDENVKYYTKTKSLMVVLPFNICKFKFLVPLEYNNLNLTQKIVWIFIGILRLVIQNVKYILYTEFKVFSICDNFESENPTPIVSKSNIPTPVPRSTIPTPVPRSTIPTPVPRSTIPTPVQKTVQKSDKWTQIPKATVPTSCDGRNIHPIDKDGNCMFEAIAFQMNKKFDGTITGETLRKISTDWLERNPFFELKDRNYLRNMCETYPCYNDDYTTWENYINRIKETGTYGEAANLFVISHLYNITINVYASHNKEIYAIFDEGTSGINVGNIDILFDTFIKHYDAILPK